MSLPPLRIGLSGLGTVGVGVIRILTGQAELLAARTGRKLELVAICARSRSKDRGVDLTPFAWEDDPVKLATRDDIDLYIELMGGEDGPAKASVEAALAAGKHVVTANKALLAHHGTALAAAADAANVALKYEAAVAGGIPVIKALGQGLAANQITKVMGVMNGTCNYILTRMEDAGLSYEAAFAEADGLGYLEADPNLDVGGIDAGHKLALLASLAFGTQPDFAGVTLEGIGGVTAEDIAYAGEMGFRIKLLGLAEETPDGLSQSMRPCLVPHASPLAQLDGGTNMVVIEGDAVGQIVLRGAGAGEGPTASAVMADVMDIARGDMTPPFGVPTGALKAATSSTKDSPAPYYLRMILQDTTGTLANISTLLAEAGISVDRMRQKQHEGAGAPVVIVTHPAERANIDAALAALSASEATLGSAVAFKIAL